MLLHVIHSSPNQLLSQCGTYSKLWKQGLIFSEKGKTRQKQDKKAQNFTKKGNFFGHYWKGYSHTCTHERPTVCLAVCLSLQTLMSIHNTWLTWWNWQTWCTSCYNFFVSNDFMQMVNFPTQISDCDSHRSALMNLLLLSDPSVCPVVAFLYWVILVMLLSQFQ